MTEESDRSFLLVLSRNAEIKKIIESNIVAAFDTLLERQLRI